MRRASVTRLLLAACLHWAIHPMFAVVSTADDHLDASSEVRETVTRAIPYLKRAGEAWIKKRQCVSCHQVPFMLWSLSAAEDQGYDVGSDQLRKWQAWATDVVSFVKPENKPDLDLDATMASNIDTMNGLLLGIPANKRAESSSETDWRERFTKSLIQNQATDGVWRACGQLPLQKRPKKETTQVTTMWTLLALARENSKANDPSAAAIFVENNAPASTEWHVARLLLAKQLSQDAQSKIRTQLLRLQQKDGGWGWLSDEPSDALATGMALYALTQTRPTDDSDRDAIANAKVFLTKTQRPDGSWAVPGTKKTTRKKPTPTSNYWGTAWAVIGLLQQ